MNQHAIFSHRVFWQVEGPILSVPWANFLCCLGLLSVAITRYLKLGHLLRGEVQIALWLWRLGSSVPRALPLPLSFRRGPSSCNSSGVWWEALQDGDTANTLGRPGSSNKAIPPVTPWPTNPLTLADLSHLTKCPISWKNYGNLGDGLAGRGWDVRTQCQSASLTQSMLWFWCTV